MDAERFGIKCPTCNRLELLEDWECGGACEGNVICRHCATEVNIETGESSERCTNDDCEWCEFENAKCESEPERTLFS